MVYRWRPSHNIAKLLYRGSNCHNICGFHTSRQTRFATALSEKSDTVSSVSKSRVIKSRKSFAELPKAWVNADGSTAGPLGQWVGGLEAQTHKVAVEQSVPTLDGNNAGLSATGPIVPERAHQAGEGSKATTTDDLFQVKRRRRKKTDSATVAESDQTAQSSLETVVPVKRRKKRRASPVQEAGETVEQQPKTPLAAEILSNLEKFPHCILLTRVGQFYESYFEQAAEVAQLLNIKLADKPWGGQRVLMCGFPITHLDRHLKTLVQGHHRLVALCEEFLRNPRVGPKGGFDRRVSRIVTPGTLIDEPFLNQFENNYLLAISAVEDQDDTSTTQQSSDTQSNHVGLAWIDISTGEFFANHVPRDTIRDELVRLGPKEVVLDGAFAEDSINTIRKIVTEEGFFTSFMSVCDQDPALDVPPVSAQSGSDDLSAHLDSSQPSFLGMTLTKAEVAAVKLLTAYMHAHLLEHMPQLRVPSRESTTGRMQIDAHTIKALEIQEGIREGGTTGSLLNVVKRTITSGGTRLLSRWLCSPSTSLKEIHARQALVAFFHSRPDLRADLVQNLGEIQDASRIVQKFLMGRGDVGDLVSMAVTVDSWATIKKRIELEKVMENEERGVASDEWSAIDTLMAKFDGLRDLVVRINSAVGRSGTLVEGTSEESEDEAIDTEEINASLLKSLPSFGSPIRWTIRPEFSDALSSLHGRLAGCMQQKEALEQRLQSRYDASSLTLRSSPGLGMHVHIGRTKRDASKFRKDPVFIPLTESASTSTFFLQEWSVLGSEIVETTNAIYVAEKDAFDALRAEVNAYESTIRRNSRILDELDVSLAFANLAEELKLVRPVVKEDISYSVVNGRHPTVELGLLGAERQFTPNTVTFTPDSPFHVITGPNMAGKSTLLRQTALIAILAQTGSFVPADSAEIGVIDRVFSRIGAKDDLFRDRSTFMVEMLETADILRRATPQSLVIMDEVGRGTTVEDGLAIAFATIHHLLSVNRCRTLFATHFHELADMLGYFGEHKGGTPFEGVRFFCTDVDETDDGYFAYSHRLRPGVNRNSHGIKVAHLAGMPESAVGVAKTALDWLKRRREGKQHEDRAQLQLLGQRLASQRISH